MAASKIQLAEASVVGLAILSAGEVPNFLAGMLPSLFTIQSFSGGREEARQSFRKGELVGGVMSLTVGLGASLACGNALPFVATAVALGVLIGMYEWAMAHPYTKTVEMS